MKIYIDNYPSKAISLKKIDNLPCNISKFRDIYTTDGMFRIFNNKLNKLTVVDKTIKTKKLNELTLILDESYYDSKEKSRWLPLNHHVLDVIKKSYKLYPEGNISLNIIYENNIINDIYFETKENILDNNHENDILTFLSLLNNIKQY